MADNRINMPSGFGGLMRYQDEYSSKFYLKPMHILLFIAIIIGLRIILPMVF